MSEDKITNGLHAAITLILFEHDPLGINFGSNPDEYDLEAKTIIARLNNAISAQDVLIVVHEEFCHWFGEEVAGPIEKYSQVSDAIYKLWLSFNKSPR